MAGDDTHLTAFLILGPEGSGSAFIAKTISYAIGHCRRFGEWHGHGYNSDLGSETMVLHRSLPHKDPKVGYRREDGTPTTREERKRFLTTFDEAKRELPGYRTINTILTTRDRHISIYGKRKRFGGSLAENARDFEVAAPLFAAVVADDSTFIWSYETMLLIGAPYFHRLYRFFGIESEFVPEFHDGNRPYIIDPHEDEA
ncbi:hypothetical protein [Bauldia sp.]|uniref:hypothetical protein n=1 Tax=Bauldia sp. TaxID=2575872 RepID=UPI003BAB3AA2